MNMSKVRLWQKICAAEEGIESRRNGGFLPLEVKLKVALQDLPCPKRTVIECHWFLNFQSWEKHLTDNPSVSHPSRESLNLGIARMLNTRLAPL